MQMPWRTEIVEGLLGADLVGFHLAGGAQNFLYLARRLIGANTSRASVGVRSRFGHVELEGRDCSGGRLPDLDRLGRARPQGPGPQHPPSGPNRSAPRSAIPARSLLGVDRLDYTKGINVRLTAFAELLAEGRVKGDDTVLVQLATPSRERVESYQKLRERYRTPGRPHQRRIRRSRPPVVSYLHRPIPRDELIAFFVAADVMLVTPLRDGMNLVAKEYVACRSDLGGALVLSEFTGAAAELRQAYLVNPHDTEGVKDAIEAALSQSAEEGRRRMRALATSGTGPRRRPVGPAFLDALAAGRSPNR